MASYKIKVYESERKWWHRKQRYHGNAWFRADEWPDDARSVRAFYYAFKERDWLPLVLDWYDANTIKNGKDVDALIESLRQCIIGFEKRKLPHKGAEPIINITVVTDGKGNIT